MEGRCGLAHYDKLIIPDKLIPSFARRRGTAVEVEFSDRILQRYTDSTRDESEVSMERTNLANHNFQQPTTPKHNVIRKSCRGMTKTRHKSLFIFVTKRFDALAKER